MAEMVCVVCGGVGNRHCPGRSHSGMCFECARAHWNEQSRAIQAVGNAVRKGLLPKASLLTCVDCGKPARDYDHRDYTKPLEVQPVCRSCNLKRGSAFNSFYRPQAEAA